MPRIHFSPTDPEVCFSTGGVLSHSRRFVFVRLAALQITAGIALVILSVVMASCGGRSALEPGGEAGINTMPIGDASTQHAPFGLVTILDRGNDGTRFFGAFSAAAGGSAAGCVDRMVGPCHTRICSQSARVVISDGAEEIPPEAGVTAGAITISGGGLSIVMQPDATDLYLQYSFGRPTSQAGDLVSFTAVGNVAGVPGFAGSVPLPGLPDSSTLMVPTVIHRNADVISSWSGVRSGVVKVGVWWASQDSSQHQAVCSFPAADNTGTIPVDALTDPMPIISANLFVRTSVESVVPAGDWQISLRAERTAYLAPVSIEP